MDVLRILFIQVRKDNAFFNWKLWVFYRSNRSTRSFLLSDIGWLYFFNASWVDLFILNITSTRKTFERDWCVLHKNIGCGYTFSCFLTDWQMFEICRLFLWHFSVFKERIKSFSFPLRWTELIFNLGSSDSTC